MLETYKPTKFSEIVGNKLAIQTLGKWFLTWPAVSTCALVSGPCGIGKTLSIDLLTKQPEYNVMEVNSDDERNEGFIKTKVALFVKTKKNMWGKINVLVVNDIDVSQDNGFLGALCGCVKETKIPIILTCNDRYEPKIKTLAALCTDIKLFKPPSADICRYITDIVKKELKTSRLTTNQTQLIQSAIETADGDVRNSILSAEFSLICGMGVGVDCGTSAKKTNKLDNKKDKTKRNLFDLTTDIMSQMTDFVDKVDLFNMEKDLLPLMVHENYPHNIMKTKTPQETLYHLSFASQCMSDYDMMPYEYNSISILTATTVCHPKSRINFTGYLGKISSKTKRSNILTTAVEPRVGMPVGHFRLDYMSYMLMLLYNQINSPKVFVDKCVSYGFSKEDIQDNLSAILIADGPYTMCDYSGVDKKIKASLTKQFTLQQKQQSTAELTTKGAKKKTKESKEKESKETTEHKEPKTPSKKATTPKASKKILDSIPTTTPTLPPTPQPSQPPQATVMKEESTPITKPTATVFRKRTTKTVEPSVVATPPPPPIVEEPKQSLPTAELELLPVPATRTIVRKRVPKQPSA